MVAYGYFPCQSDGDDVVIYKNDMKTERTRFTFPRMQKKPYLCIADFFNSVESGQMDVMPIMLVTIGSKATPHIQNTFKENKYQDYLYLHGLSVETVEALAEYWHRRIREELEITGHDAKEVRKFFQQNYQGSRYSFGYPACPRLEDQAKLMELLEPDRIGVTLTEEFQLDPEQSTSAIILHHPQAKYFSVE
jgi:5-methyltetrahydrofolate--homocysteine methyltransferase